MIHGMLNVVPGEYDPLDLQVTGTVSVQYLDARPGTLAPLDGRVRTDCWNPAWYRPRGDFDDPLDVPEHVRKRMVNSDWDLGDVTGNWWAYSRCCWALRDVIENIDEIERIPQEAPVAEARCPCARMYCCRPHHPFSITLASVRIENGIIWKGTRDCRWCDGTGTIRAPGDGERATGIPENAELCLTDVVNGLCACKLDHRRCSIRA